MDAICHFGEIVKNSDSSHILRREEIDRYLHLATFCAYQRCIFEDWMARTFLSVCKVAVNKASSIEKERLFRGRRKRKKTFQQVVHIAESKMELLQRIRQITWMNIPAID